MKTTTVSLIACLAFAATSAAQENRPGPADMAKMMEQAKKFTTPGTHHEFLKKFIGKWDVQINLVMGGREMPGEKGTCTTEWLMEGRWLKTTIDSSLMGRPYQSVTIMGYDNFKQSYVTTTVSNIDTAMNSMEGDLDPDGKTLLIYGTIDEYLTGEHDKMVKAVFRLKSDTEHTMEVHDLPIGEHNTKVLEFKFTRSN